MKTNFLHKILPTLALLAFFISCTGPATPDTNSVFSVPEDFSVSQGLYSNQIKLSWNMVASASAYEIYRSESPDNLEPSWDIFTTSEDFYLDQQITVGKTYYYQVRAVAGTQKTDFTELKSGYAALSTDQPNQVSASKGTYLDKIRISWNTVADASGYYVYVSQDVVGSYTRLNSQAITATEFSHTAVNPSETYYYKVSAYFPDKGMEGPKSSIVQGFRASAPLSLQLNTLQEGKLASGETRIFTFQALPGYQYQLSWEKSALSSTSCDCALSVYQSDQQTLILDSDRYTPSFPFQVQEASTVYIKMKGFFPSSQGAFSLSIKRYLAAPTRINASDGLYTNRVSITWDPVFDIKGYYLYRSASGNGDYYKVSQDLLTETVFQDTTAEKNKTYYYKVSAVNQEDQESALSLYNPGYRRGPYLSLTINNSNVAPGANIFALVYDTSGKLVASSSNNTQLINNQLTFIVEKVSSVQNGQIYLSGSSAQLDNGDYTVYVFLNDDDDAKIESGEAAAVAQVSMAGSDQTISLSNTDFNPTIDASVSATATGITNGNGLTCSWYAAGSIASNTFDYPVGTSRSETNSFLEGQITTDKHIALPAGTYDLVCQDTATGTWSYKGQLNFNGDLTTVSLMQ